MNISGIIAAVKMTFSDLGRILKEIIRLPHAKKYLLLAIPFTFLFLIFTFPYDVLIRKKLLAMENVYFKSVYVDDVEFSFFSYIRLTNLGLVFKDSDEMSAGEILVDPSLNPYRLFVSRRMLSSLEINRFSYMSNKGKEINASINGNIDITVNKAGAPESGFIKLIIQNMTLRLNEVNLPSQLGGFPLKIPPVKITTMSIDTAIKNKNLNINSIKITGPDLRGTVTGTISLEPVFSNSRLNVNVSVEADSPMIAGYKELLIKFTNSEGMIVLPVRGTIQNPVIETEARTN
jgi:hypothetical protein